MRQAIEAVRHRLAVEHDPLEGEGRVASSVIATNSLAQAIAAPQTHALAVFVGEDADPVPLRFARREVRPIDLLHGLLKTANSNTSTPAR